MENFEEIYYNFVDEHLDKTNHMYSLLYLYVLRFAVAGEKIPTIPQQAERLQLIPSDVSSAWLFWVQKGLARIDGDAVELTMIDAETPQNESNYATPEQPDSEFAWFAGEVAVAFGGQVAARDMETVKWLYSELGLDVFVLNMLIQFAREKNKTMSEIEKMAIDWKEKNIDTIEKAERHIKNTRVGGKLVKEREARRGNKTRGINNYSARETEDRSDIERARMEELLEEARKGGVDV